MSLDDLIAELREALPEHGHYAVHAVWADTESDFRLVSTPVLDIEVDSIDDDINLVADTTGQATATAEDRFTVSELLLRLQSFQPTMGTRPVFAATLRTPLSDEADTRFDWPLIGISLDDANARFGVLLWSKQLEERLREDTA